MKRRELLGKMAVIASGSVLLGTVPSKANEKPKNDANSDNNENVAVACLPFFTSIPFLPADNPSF